MTSDTRSNRRLPRLPLGCERAKSSAVKPRLFNRATAEHYVAHFCLVNVRARIESAAQIPVRKDAENFVVAVDDRRHAEAFLRHFHEAISQIDV